MLGLPNRSTQHPYVVLRQSFYPLYNLHAYYAAKYGWSNVVSIGGHHINLTSCPLDYRVVVGLTLLPFRVIQQVFFTALLF